MSHSANSLVSIRCRRHKKRFNVPVTWLRICEWLCPKCFEKLTPVEREKYSPKKENSSEIRPFDEHSKIISIKIDSRPPQTPLKDEEEEWTGYSYKDKPINSKEGEAIQTRRNVKVENKVQRKACEDSREGKEQNTNARDKNREEAVKSPASEGEVEKICNRDSAPSGGIRDSLASLMPRFRINCKKCQKIVPCHKSWFANSMVLCPGCYSGMTDAEISMFHATHPQTSAEVFEVASVVPLRPQNTNYRATTKVGDVSLQSPSRWSLADGVSNEFIVKASVKELLRAVRNGRLSKARARIEINRRKNTSYFNNLPDADVKIVSLS